MVIENLILFLNDELVEDIKEVMVEIRYYSYFVIDVDSKVVGIVVRYYFIFNYKKKVI